MSQAYDDLPQRPLTMPAWAFANGRRAACRAIWSQAL